jgi:hypothetical protein
MADYLSSGTGRTQSAAQQARRSTWREGRTDGGRKESFSSSDAS